MTRVMTSAVELEASIDRLRLFRDRYFEVHPEHSASQRLADLKKKADVILRHLQRESDSNSGGSSENTGDYSDACCCSLAIAQSITSLHIIIY